MIAESDVIGGMPLFEIFSDQCIHILHSESQASVFSSLALTLTIAVTHSDLLFVMHKCESV